MTTVIEYTLVFERNALTGWTGYVRQLPQLEKVQGSILNEVKYQLAGQLVDIVWAMPNEKDIRITSEFHYNLPTSPEHLSSN